MGLAPKERMVKIFLSKSCIKKGAHLYFINWIWTLEEIFARALVHLVFRLWYLVLACGKKALE